MYMYLRENYTHFPFLPLSFPRPFFSYFSLYLSFPLFPCPLFPFSLKSLYPFFYFPILSLFPFLPLFPILPLFPFLPLFSLPFCFPPKPTSPFIPYNFFISLSSLCFPPVPIPPFIPPTLYPLPFPLPPRPLPPSHHTLARGQTSLFSNKRYYLTFHF